MKGKSIFKRLTAALVALLMVFSALPSFELVKAVDIDPTEHLADSATINNWKTFFGNTTENAGAVWTDKSVFASSANFDGKTIVLDDEDNFLVSLSAIASNKSIQGYSYRPTDTILVLDISGSMFQNITSANAARNSRAAKMVEAANEAIKSLLALNRHNRVGVIFYSSGVDSFMLPLDHYEASDGSYLVFEYKAPENNNNNRPGPGGGNNQNRNYSAYIKTGENLKNSNGRSVSDSLQVTGGTYIQAGLQAALDEFLDVNDTEISAGEFQAGTTRLPITVLMTDGAPTYATTSFANVGDSNIGNGSSSSDIIAFLTQLTSVYLKNRVEDHYNTESYFYTLGIGTSGDSVATSVLNPANSSSDVVDYWNTYNSARQSMSIIQGSGRNEQEYTITKNSLVTAADRVYVDKPFSANTTTDIVSAFNDIVSQIIIQSRYYPTDIESGDANLTGDISFKDELGLYMEVKDIKGILVGNVLYSGEAVAKSINDNDLGTTSNPTALGDEFVHAVKERIGVDTATAQTLIREAWLAGQLSYNSRTGEYSNYIGWYADKDGKFVGFWDGESIEAPANYPNAVYANKSYGYIGTTGSGAMASDMMYTSVQVHTRIATGTTAVIFKVPAAIIPIISYDVQLDGDSYETSRTAEVTKTEAYPVRLVYEVGLRSDINEITVADKVGTDYIRYNAETGAYTFYTNRWDDHVHIEGNHLPDDHINALAYFSPAEENERYYYIEDTLIYTDTNGTLYTGNANPSSTSNTYYRAYYIFSNENGIETVYEEIHRNNSDPENSTIHKAVRNEARQWVIPMGTIHRYDYQSEFTKVNNETGTYAYSAEPIVNHYTDPATGEDIYFSTRFLGNNGKLTIVPTQGIKITKTVEGVLPEGEHTFEFTVTNTTDTSDSDTYEYVHYAVDGTETEGRITFVNGKATVNLEAGETMYIVGLVTGETFEVEEVIPENAQFYLKSVNGSSEIGKATITVEKFVISDAAFANAYLGAGHLVVAKTVTHELGDDYVIPANVSFEIKVNVGSHLAGKIYDTIIRHANGSVADDGNVTVGADGVITFSIKDGDVVLISGLPENTEYTVAETEVAGFVPSIEGANGTISADENSYAIITNDYQPDPADASVLTNVGTKELDGRDWLDTDKFTFVLERFDGTNFGEIDRITVDSTDVDAATGLASFSFDGTLQNEVFDTAGTYQYRITEVKGNIGGVEYSEAVYNIVITVGDEDMNGQLEIVSVGTSRAVEGEFTVETPFINTYSAKGGASVTLNIQKLIKDINGNGTNVSLEGYKFQIYDLNGNAIGEEMTTDANGTVTYERTYTSDAIGNTYNYIVKEVDTGKDGIVYSDEEYAFSVTIVDNLDGTVGAVIHETGTEGEEASYSVSFTNTYNPKGEIVLEGVKFFNSTVQGVGLIDHAFRFEVSENGTIVAEGYNVGTVQSGETTLQDPIVFEAIEYTLDDVGTHTYTITEVKDNATGVTYDESEITVVVEVTDDGSGVLKAEIVNAQSEAIEFTNTYEPEDTDLTLIIEGATKTLNGRDMNADEFSFYVYPYDEAAGEYDMTNKVATGTNAAAKDGEEALITFSPISISTNEPGTLKFLVVEYKGGTSENGVSYAGTTFEIEVEIVNDTEGVCSIGTVTHDIAFENTYSSESAFVTITGVKHLDGRDMIAGEFSFELKDEDGNVLQTKSNAENGTITFDPIEYTLEDAGKTFTYTVNEVIGELGGVVYDDSVKTVKVLVTDDGKGQICAVITADSDAVSFVNYYNHAPAETEILISKTLNGRDMADSEFTFEVVDPNGVQVATVTNTAAADGEEVTMTVKFDVQESGTYTVREIHGNVNGVTYSTAVYRVNVTVTDNGDGTATATVQGGAGIAFVNTYEATATLTLTGTKVLTGRGWVESDIFDFVVTENGEVVANGLNNKTNITFDTITYTLEDVGTHTYIVSEGEVHKKGIARDDTTYEVTVTVSDNGDGTLKVETVGADAIAFENVYNATGSLTIEATKTITGKNIEEETFTFELKDEEGNVLQTKNNVGTDITFDAIEYTLEDVGETFIYTVSEVDEGKEGYVYDDTVYTVTVTVTDGGHGELIVTAVGADAIAFANSYGATQGTLTFDGVKTITGDRTELTEDDVFTFEVRDENDAVVDTAVNDENGVIAFEIPLTAVGDFKFYISEVDGDDDTITYDDSIFVIDVEVTDNGNGKLIGEIVSQTEIVFENVYTKPEVIVTVTGTKTLEADGRELKSEEFGFIITDEEGSTETVYNNAQGVITFTKTYYAPGTYVYTIHEDSSENELGMDYDERVYTITVTVNDDFTYSVVTTLNGTEADILFENSYEYIDTNAYASIRGTKVLSGKTLEAGEFSFTIVGSDGTNKTVTNSADGSIDFGTFTYTTEGVYTYTISEVKGSDKNVTYDNEVYTVTITVTDSGNGVLVASAPVIASSNGAYAGGIIFNNKYDDGDSAPKGTYMELIVKKDVVDNTGDGYDLDGFVFVLKNETTGDVYTATSNASGYATFGIHIGYGEIGQKYTYTLTELNTEISGMVYDETIHEFEVQVTYIPTINMATTYITKDGEHVKTNLIATFTNTYNGIEEITPPDEPDKDPVESACEEEEAVFYKRDLLIEVAYGI